MTRCSDVRMIRLKLASSGTRHLSIFGLSESATSTLTMKLLRYGPTGKELPGILDSAGHIRSLVNVVEDIAGDSLSPAALRQASRARSRIAAAGRAAGAHRPVRRPRRQVHRHRPELLGARGRDRRQGSRRAGHVHEGHELHQRPERRHRASRAAPRKPTGKSSWASSSAPRPST